MTDAGTVTFANDLFRSLLGKAPAGGLVGARLERIVPAVTLPDPDDAGGDRVATISLAAGRNLAVTWTRIGPDGWIGTIVVPERRASVPTVASLRRDGLTELANRSAFGTVVG